ncbi:hypothetical protein MP228_004164 [Amoeboaphelidium protococcarum]|nr:hypothetical protein MP228_004164 [Amoeboaphelidium protococcarum]
MYAQKLVAVVVISVCGYILANDTPLLPLTLPTQTKHFQTPSQENHFLSVITINNQQYANTSTNLFAILFDSDQDKLDAHLNNTFNKITPNKSGVITVQQLQAGMEQLESPKNASMDPLFKALVQDYKDQSTNIFDGNQDGNITVNEFREVVTKTLTHNFTLYSGICHEARQRLDICNVNLTTPVADGNISRFNMFVREDTKCTSGLSGIENDFAFQKCIIGSPCFRIGDCFDTQYKQSNAAIDLIVAANKNIDKVVAPLVNERQTPIDQGSNTKQQAIMGISGSFQVINAGLLSWLAVQVVQALKTSLAPLISQGVGAIVQASAAWVAALSASQIFVGVALVAVLGFFIFFAVQNNDTFWTLLRDVFIPRKQNELEMIKWDPDAGEMEFKCEWSVYMPTRCSGKQTMEKDYWSICPHGGEPYIDRECGNGQWKFFYQQACGPFGKCRHLCQNTNFECGNDGYTYKNRTEFIYTYPSKRVNPYMFNKSFNDDQLYAILDLRYVYQMSQCRETCNNFSAAMTGRDGFSGCVGFVLSAPDQMLDQRPAFQRRMVCRLLARVTSDSSSISYNNQTYYPLLMSDKDVRPVPSDTDYPLILQNANMMFGYNVMRKNDYPPMIVAMKD